MILKNKNSFKKIGQAAGIFALSSVPGLQSQAYDLFGPEPQPHQVEIKQLENNGYRQVVYSFNNTSDPIKKNNSDNIKNVAADDGGKISIEYEKNKLVQEIERLRNENDELKKQIKIFKSELEKYKEAPKKNNESEKDTKAILLSEQQSKLENSKMNSQGLVSSSDPNDTHKKLTGVSELHHVVYIFKTHEEQQKFWDTLSSLGDNDRWQGVSKKNGRYFIYVGAYKYKNEAVQRSDFLNKLTGKKPVVYSKKN